jgi:hypothetical protein
MFLLNEKPLVIGNPFQTLDGTQYPANWLQLSTEEDRIAIGISEVPDNTVYYDDRFYWGADNPKDLDSLKNQWIAQVKDTAGKMLAQTDWVIIRKAERNIAIPDDVKTYRAAIVAECDQLELDIEGCNNVDEFINVVTNQNWPNLKVETQNE